MASAQDAHTRLTTFCQGQPGVAIGRELIEYVIKNAVQQANAGGSGGNPILFPSNNPWRSMPVGFTMKLDPSKVKVAFNPLTGPPGTDPIPLLTITGLAASFGIYVHEELFSTHSLTYSEISAAFQVTGHKLSLVKQTITSDWDKPTVDPDPNEVWRQMTKLPDGKTFTPQAQSDWETQERAYMLLAQDAMGTSFIEAATLPNVLGMIKAFDFTGPISLSGTTDLLMLTGTAIWNFGCSRRPEDMNLEGVPATRPPVPAIPTSKQGKLPPTTFSTRDKPGDGGYPEMSNAEHSDQGDVFVHLPKIFMQHRFDGIAKPSVTFSDEGSVAIIHWHYEASVSPAPGSTLTITLVNPWPTEFLVSLPLLTFGAAGAGVKIACIYYEAVGLHYRGKVDPFEVYFKIGLDWNKGDLYFESHLGNVRAVDFAFDTFPRLEFPISEIADFILGQAASHLINSQAGQILSVTRFSLADFDLFKGFGKMRNLLAAVPDNVATTYGVSFDKQ